MKLFMLEIHSARLSTDIVSFTWLVSAILPGDSDVSFKLVFIV